MEIVKGKTYAVSPRWKKSFEENESWADDSGRVITISTLWRGGTINITPMNDDEVDELQEAVYNEYGDIFEPYGFEEHEYDSAFDGISCDLYFSSSFDDDDEVKKLEEGYDDDGICYLEEQGFYSDDCEVFFHGELDIEEV
jgi:hypothetical protein